MPQTDSSLSPITYISLVFLGLFAIYVYFAKKQKRLLEERAYLEQYTLKNNYGGYNNPIIQSSVHNLPTFSAAEFNSRKQPRQIDPVSIKPKNLFADPMFGPTQSRAYPAPSLSTQEFRPYGFNPYETRPNPYLSENRDSMSQSKSVIDTSKDLSQERYQPLRTREDDYPFGYDSGKRIDREDQYPSDINFGSHPFVQPKKPQFGNNFIPNTADQYYPSFPEQPAFRQTGFQPVHRSETFGHFQAPNLKYSSDTDNEVKDKGDLLKKKENKNYYRDSQRFESPDRPKKDKDILQRLNHSPESPFKLVETSPTNLKRKKTPNEDDYDIKLEKRMSSHDKFSRVHDMLVESEPTVVELTDSRKRKTTLTKKPSNFFENGSEEKTDLTKREKPELSRAGSKEIRELDSKKKLLKTNDSKAKVHKGKQSDESEGEDEGKSSTLKKELQRKRTPIDLSYLSEYGANSSLKKYVAKKTVQDHHFRSLETPPLTSQRPPAFNKSDLTKLPEPAKTETKSGGLFANTTSTTTTTTTTTANTTATTTTTTGDSSANKGSLFGNAPKPETKPATQTESKPATEKKDEAPKSGLFTGLGAKKEEQKAAPTTQEEPKKSSLFSNAPTTSNITAPTENKPSTENKTETKPAGGLFGNLTKPAETKPTETKPETQENKPATNVSAPSGEDLFKTQRGPPPTLTKPGGLFGNQPQTKPEENKPAGSSLFGNLKPSENKSAPTQEENKKPEDKPQPTEVKSSLFGGSTGGSSLFTQNTQSQPQSSAPGTQQGSSGSLLFGNKPAENKPAENKPAETKTENKPFGGLFGNQNASTSGQTGTDSQKIGGGLFGGMTTPTLQKTPSIPNLMGAGGATGSSLFGAGNKPSDNKPAENQQSSENKTSGGVGGLLDGNKSTSSGSTLFGGLPKTNTGTSGLFGNSLLGSGNASAGPSLFGNNATSGGNSTSNTGGILGKLGGGNTGGGGLFSNMQK